MAQVSGDGAANDSCGLLLFCRTPPMVPDGTLDPMQQSKEDMHCLWCSTGAGPLALLARLSSRTQYRIYAPPLVFSEVLGQSNLFEGCWARQSSRETQGTLAEIYRKSIIFLPNPQILGVVVVVTVVNSSECDNCHVTGICKENS